MDRYSTSRRFAPLAAMLAAMGAAAAGEIPPERLDAGERDLIGWMAEEHFNRLLDVHVVQYAADPEWAAEWAAARFSGSGLFGEYGSTSGRHLLNHTDLMLNAPLSERLRLRYDRREWQDGRSNQLYERFDLQCFVLDRLALVACGRPAYMKEEGSLGGGIYVGRPGGTNALQVLLARDRYFFNEKTDTGLRYTREPARWLVDGFLERGDWRAYGSLNVVAPYDLEGAFDPDSNANPARAGAWKRYGHACAERRRDGVTAGLRAMYSGEGFERDGAFGGGDASSVSARREWWRAEAFARREWSAWSADGQIGYVTQRDRFDSALVERGRYSLDGWMFGLGTARRMGESSEVRAGYLGFLPEMERTRENPTAEPADADDWTVRRQNPYSDKVHARWIYRLRPRMRLELLLSHEISVNGFGGGSLKCLVLF